MRQPQWKTVRYCADHPDALRRWDKAFQLLLEMTPQPNPNQDRSAGEPPSQESLNADPCRLRARLNPASGSEPIDRPAD